MMVQSTDIVLIVGGGLLILMSLIVLCYFKLPRRVYPEATGVATGLASSRSSTIVDDDLLGLCYGNICNICLEKMDGKSTIGKISSCNHSFHRSCIVEWYDAQASNGEVQTCPTCRDFHTYELVLTKVIS